MKSNNKYLFSYYNFSSARLLMRENTTPESITIFSCVSTCRRCAIPNTTDAHGCQRESSVQKMCVCVCAEEMVNGRNTHHDYIWVNIGDDDNNRRNEWERLIEHKTTLALCKNATIFQIIRADGFRWICGLFLLKSNRRHCLTAEDTMSLSNDFDWKVISGKVLIYACLEWNGVFSCKRYIWWCFKAIGSSPRQR